jgi:hypothetical protein
MKHICFILFTFIATISFSQQVLVNDHFQNRDQFIDNSMLLIWGSNSTPTSAYELTTKTDNDGLSFDCICLTDSALPWAQYHDTAKPTLKASTCLDWEFGPVDRSYNDTLMVEFDVIWNELNSGERGRINAILLHEYPDGGAEFNDVDNLFKHHPFGRPAYHFRARNSKTVVDKGFIGIGGGNQLLGRLYIHDEYVGPDSLHWLPGAVPPTSDHTVGPATFPDSINQKSFQATIASNTKWRHITWILEPVKMKLYVRNSIDSTMGYGTLASEIDIPKTNPGNYFSLYHWYDRIEAFRIYFNGLENNTYLANLKISTTGVVTSENEIQKNNKKIIVFPNPFNEKICVTSEQPNGNIKILDVCGSLIHESNLYTYETCIHIPYLEKGIYLLRYSGKQELTEIILKK